MEGVALPLRYRKGLYRITVVNALFINVYNLLINNADGASANTYVNNSAWDNKAK